jgi:tRNA(Ile)-lysidine synthase
MGGSPTPRTAEARVAVAYSGGPDSTALLHATCRALRGTGVEVVALHVHHGLVADADAWASRARILCERWRRAGAPLRLRIARLEGSPARGESVEAWARRGRYEALAALAHEEGATLVLLAHHRRDQAETVLLQLLRGAGPAGLAAMPRLRERAGLTWARPWLDQPREAVEAYLARHRLRSVVDPSNVDRRYARSRLRRDVWPALKAAFPAAETALAQAARRAADVDAALAELAAIDIAGCADAQGLRVADWLALAPPRRANALRHWCRDALGQAPPHTLVTRLMRELPDRRAARWPAPGVELRLYRGRLSAAAAAPSRVAAPTCGAVDLSHPGRWPLPAWHGAWIVTACRSAGLAASDLSLVELRPRAGGERFALPPNGMPRSLKKQFQACAVDAPARSGPLVWRGDRLLFVPGLGADARALAPAGVAQRALRWEPDPTPAGARPTGPPRCGG